MSIDAGMLCYRCLARFRRLRRDAKIGLANETVFTVRTGNLLGRWPPLELALGAVPPIVPGHLCSRQRPDNSPV